MRYGSFRYGGEKYGASAVDTQLWALLVDWNGDGIYDSANEAGRMTDLVVTRGRRNLIDSSGTGFEPVAIGRLVVELDNTDGRYHPRNTRSPLYPYVRPGVKMAVLIRLPGSGEIHPVFAGRIEDIVPISGRTDRIRLIASDGLAWLNDPVEIHIQINQRLDDNLETLLEAAQWPWEMALESSTDVIPWFWAPAGRSVHDVVNELAKAHWGTFFCAADGAATYYSRNHQLSSAKMRIEQEQIAGDVVMRAPWEVIKNRITMISHPRTQQNTDVVWSLHEVPEVADGETFEVWSTFSAEGGETPIGAYTNPEAGTDYSANTASDGTGTDLTALCSVTVIVYAGSVVYRLTNGSGENGYITLMQLRGQALTDNTVKLMRTDDASQALFGPKTLTIDSPFLQDQNLAQAIADALIGQLAQDQVYPTVTIVNRPETQYTLDLFDYIDLVIDEVEVAGLYQVAYIEHRWLSESGQASETIFGFEPVTSTLETVWTFPAQIGIDTIFAF